MTFVNWVTSLFNYSVISSNNRNWFGAQMFSFEFDFNLNGKKRCYWSTFLVARVTWEFT